MKRSYWIAGSIGLLIGSAATFLAQQTYTFFSPYKHEKPVSREPRNAKVDTSLDPSIGSEDAPITIVEFSDFECPYCKQFHDQVFPRIKSDFIDKGLVRFVHKDLPLPFHKNAYLSAQAARCSDDQGNYWDVYHSLFDQQDCLQCKGPLNIAKEKNEEPAELDQCIRQKKVDQAININISEAQVNGIRATPSFIIGPTKSDLFEGLVITGARPWNEFRDAIQRELSKSRRESLSKTLKDQF